MDWKWRYLRIAQFTLEEMTDDDLLDQQRAFEEADNDTSGDNVQMKEFTLQEFENMFRGI